MWSTVPAFIVSLILFMILGQTYANTSLTEVVQVIQVLKTTLPFQFGHCYH